MATAPPSFGGGRAPRPARTGAPDPRAYEGISDGIGRLGQNMVRAETQRRENEELIGAAVDRAKLAADALDQSLLTGKLSADLAARQGALQAELAEMRTRAGPGAEGHDEAVAGRVEAFRNAFLDEVEDPRLQAEFADNVAQIGAAAEIGEARWAIEQRSVRAVTDSNNLADRLGANIFTAATTGTATAEMLATATTQWNEQVDRLPLPDNAREEVRRNGHRTIQEGAMRGVIASAPGAAIEQIDAGWGRDLFSPDELARLRQQGVSAQEHAASLARAEARAAAATSNAEARVLIEQVEEGVMVDTAAMQAHLARVEGSTEPDDIALAHDLRVGLARNAVTARYDGETPAARRAAIREIEATRGWQQNEQLVAAHTQLAALNQRDERRVSTGQIETFTRQTGAALGPLNLADPDAMNRRFATGDGAGRFYGRPPQYLTEDEARQMREDWGRAPPAARARTIAQLAQYGMSRAGLMMRQIMPENADALALLRLATMRDRRVGAAWVAEALDGWAAPASAQVAPTGRMEALANQRFGAAIGGMPGDLRAGHMSVARAIYAHRTAQRGIGHFDEALWIESLQDAWGRSGATGGFSSGPSGPWLVPLGMTAGDVNLVGRQAQDRPDLAARAAGGDTPVWSNGQELSIAQVIRLQPVLVFDDGRRSARYQFRSEAGFVRSRTNPAQNYTLDIRMLALLALGPADLRARR